MLTERIVRDEKPGSKTRIIWDRQVKGLGLRITPAGAKSYILNYRTAGRERRATLARASEITLKAARDRAGAELAAIRAGETDPLERRREAMDAPTVADGLARFFEEYVPERIATGRMTETTSRKYRNQADNYLRPALGRRRVADVTRLDIEAMAKRLARTPTLRNRVLAFASRLFRLFEDWEWRPQHTNPVRGVSRAKEQARDRVLASSELAALSAALDEREASQPFPVAAIRVAAMTGLRINECLSMRWEHVSFEMGRVVLPKTKTGRRVVPLAAPVLELLSRLPHVNGCPWVFAGARSGAPVTYRTTRNLFAAACEAAGLEGVRLHDLRRSVATNLAASGANAFVLRDALGHRTLAMSNRYVQAASDALTDAMERAAAIASAAMEGKPGADVVPLRKVD